MLLSSITYLLSSLDMIVYLLFAYNISILLGEKIRRIVFPCCKFFLLYIYAYVQHKKIMNAELCFIALSHVSSLLQNSTWYQSLVLEFSYYKKRQWCCHGRPL